MNIKIVGMILCLLILGISALLVLSSSQKTNETPFDFGDAPDGKESGSFPSLFKSNGARAKNTDEIWLGLKVNTEKDSKQVDLDEGDDGLKLNLTSCKTSKAHFFVHLKNPRELSGTAYLNLYADWNKDGKWNGGDECASEWTVQNFPVDLSKQNQEISVYSPEFTAGKNIEDFWYRGVVSLNQQMNEVANGEFESGEVEDYNVKEPEGKRYYGAYCDPDPLDIKHGDKGDIKILPVLFSEPINKVEFGQNFNPQTDKRKVSLQDNVLTYESKDIDPPKRSDKHFIDFKVSFGAGGVEAILNGSCVVNVEHDEITIETPSQRTVPHQPFPTPSISSQSEPHPQEKVPGLMGY